MAKPHLHLDGFELFGIGYRTCADDYAGTSLAIKDGVEADRRGDSREMLHWAGLIPTAVLVNIAITGTNRAGGQALAWGQRNILGPAGDWHRNRLTWFQTACCLF